MQSEPYSIQHTPQVGARLAVCFREEDGSWFVIHGTQGTIIRVVSQRCWVQRDDGTKLPYDDFEYQHLMPLCRNCDLPRGDHADNGKCLYSPTSWEN